MRNIILLSVILIIILSGCGKNNAKSEKEIEKETLDSSETVLENSSKNNPFLYQLEVFYKLRNEWALDEGAYVDALGDIIEFEAYGYAVSDLDHDDLY